MQSESSLKRESLITNESRDSKPRPQPRKIGLDTLAVFIFIAIMLVIIAISLVVFMTSKQDSVAPVKVSIPWFADRVIILQLGTSRVFEANLYSGYDNRTYNNFLQVTEREVEWSVEPPGIATVDMYGRVNAVKVGECKLKLRSKPYPDINDQRVILVVAQRTDVDNVPRRVINFKGGAASTVSNLQKLVDRIPAGEAAKDPNVPQSVKYAIGHLTQKYNITVMDDKINWTICNHTVNPNRQYILRTDLDKIDDDKDKLQYFIGDRYLPDAGTSVIMIESDKQKGLWVVGASGNVTHIRMVPMTYREKAEMMNDQTDKYVTRQGLASGAYFDGTKWVPQVSDNDGLWTAMYGAGQLMKYAVLKQNRSDPSLVSKARTRALNSLKAVLLVANVAGRQGKINAKIRYLNNTRVENGVNYRKQYLLAGKPNIRDTYSGLPSDGNAFYGLDAGTNYTGDYIAGRFKYSQLPINKDDWAESGAPALTEKHLEGFWSRTFVVPDAGVPVPSGGLFFRRHNNSTHTVLSGAHTLYDYTDNDHPNLELGNKPIPQVLKSILNINGTQYNASDLVYKGDTSTDEVIGHLFIYKIAYDILDDEDNEEKQLKGLIRETMRNFCQHLINNGYLMVDATGQATKWTKLYKEFLGSDYTIEDGVLKTIQLLMSFKVAYYVTGQRKFKDEYNLLTKDSQYRYIDMFGHVWSRWVWAFTKCDDNKAGLYKFNPATVPSEVEIQRHVLYSFHFSDEEEAYLAYYLAFQLEEDEKLREEYRKGLNAYWHSISKSENPLWYYIYQLSSPEKALNDSFSQDLRETAAWQLSRHMVDTTEYQAFIKGSRPDVIFQGGISVNPYKIVGKRSSVQDQKYVNQPINKQIYPQFNPNNIYEVRVLPADERSIHKLNGASFDNIDGSHNKNSIQPATTFTLPYWLGVYHGLIKLN